LSDEVRSVTLRPGERATVRLPGLGTVGYQWTSRMDGDSGAVQVSISTAPAEEIAGSPPGVSVDEIAVIEGRRPGRTTVILEQRRAWENKPEPRDRRIIDVVVP